MLSGEKSRWAHPGRQRPHPVRPARRTGSIPDCLAATWWELLGLAALATFYVVGEDMLGRDSLATVNTIGSSTFIALLGAGLWRMVRINTSAIWTSLFWFRLASIIYFGYGSLVPYITGPATRIAMERLHPFGDDELTRFNLLVTLSVLTVLGIVRLLPGGRGSARTEPGSAPAKAADRAFAIGLAFYCVGATIKYLIVLPSLLGLTQGVMIGTVGTLSELTVIGIYLLTVWSVERRRAMLPLIGLAVLSDMATGLITFAKTAVLFSPLVFSLGLLRRDIKAISVFLVTAFLLTIYILITPIVSFGREQIGQRYGSIAAPVGIGERIEILTTQFSRGSSIAPNADTEVNWAALRTSYVNAGTFAMYRYDRGLPGDSMRNILAVFIPRVLWPDKPVITDLGPEFTLIAMGFDTSATGVTIFAESYWNFGWWGVPAIMIPLALIFAFTSRFALGVLARGDWLYLPIVLIAMRMGYGIIGFFVPEIIGSVVIMFAFYVIIALVARLLATLRAGVRSRSA